MDVGLYGKLPTHGDFLRRRVADDFVNAWDPWLQHCIADSRAVLGEPWLETYLTSPVWRFALAPHVCGAAPVAGLLVPSVDRVGRYFPLTLVWPTPIELSTLEVALRFQRGFERAERLLLDTLALEQFEFADFDRRVMELSVYFGNSNPHDALQLTRESAAALALARGRPRCIPLRTAAALEAPALQLFGSHLDAHEGALGLWWTEGCAAVEPSWLITPGLPDPANYSAMLDGAWTAAGWDLAATEPDPASTIVRASKAREPAMADGGLVIDSAALTDRGPVRTINQDAFLERADLGLWAVADGMGGLSDGEVASRMVCDSLAETPIVAGLDEQIEVAFSQLRGVNEYLHRMATRAVNPVRSGSTVVVLLIRQKECALLWAGDSRAYRLRDGLVSQMTTDHSWAAQEGADAGGGADEQAITRAVGGEDTLVPDVVRSDVRPGDRFMLCSDGIARVLDIARLGQILQTQAPVACCAELVAHSIAGGGTDNLTAVIVDCAAAAPLAPDGALDGLGR
jgi:type VI secretion system protein ImpM